MTDALRAIFRDRRLSCPSFAASRMKSCEVLSRGRDGALILIEACRTGLVCYANLRVVLMDDGYCSSNFIMIACDGLKVTLVMGHEKESHSLMTNAETKRLFCCIAV